MTERNTLAERGAQEAPAPDGLVIVDKPSGMTSHDVVSRVRRLAHTRRVGHAGTLDPMATGVLVLGIGRATRLLGHLALTDKTYEATIRLGVSTTTDDAEGETLLQLDASHLDEAQIAAAVDDLRGELDQVPSSVSAIKVDGKRSYQRVRDGEEVTLAARRVTVSRFEVTKIRRSVATVELDVIIDCSTGTYIRALARDLGAALQVGGHLSALRRTRVGPYDVSQVHTLAELEQTLVVLPLAQAAASAFVRRDVDAAAAIDVSFGRAIENAGLGPEPVAVFGPDGAFLALMTESKDGRARPLAVFTG